MVAKREQDRRGHAHRDPGRCASARPRRSRRVPARRSWPRRSKAMAELRGRRSPISRSRRPASWSARDMNATTQRRPVEEFLAESRRRRLPKARRTDRWHGATPRRDATPRRPSRSAVPTARSMRWDATSRALTRRPRHRRAALAWWSIRPCPSPPKERVLRRAVGDVSAARRSTWCCSWCGAGARGPSPAWPSPSPSWSVVSAASRWPRCARRCRSRTRSVPR